MAARLDDLWLFFEVAKAGTITAAARRLELPKSTVSRRLIRFEQEIGAKLFHKTTRKITLTGLGETYLARCERVVHEAEEARAFLDSVTTKATGVLRVTMPTDVGIYWLADFFVAFTRRHPDIRLSLDFTGRRVDLIGERFDVAIRAGALGGTDMVARKLATLERPLHASPAYLREMGTPQTPDDLARHRFVLLEAHAHPPEVDLINGRKVTRIAMQGPIVSNSLGVVRAATLAGGGIGLLPPRMCAEDVKAGRLKRVLPAWSATGVDFYYLVASRKLLPARTRLFVEEMVAHVKAQERMARRAA
jgi:DNA-binding transcriptional LysR family regulator